MDHQLILQHTHPYLLQTSTTMSPMRCSNQQASRRTPSSPSSSSSQGSNAWVNSFSQGGVGLTGSNYMTPRGEYISRPPCSRVTLQMGMSYPNTDKVIHECILFSVEEANSWVVGVVGLDERDPHPLLQLSGLGRDPERPGLSTGHCDGAAPRAPEEEFGRGQRKHPLRLVEEQASRSEVGYTRHSTVFLS